MMMMFSAPLMSVLRLEVICVPHSLVATTKVYLFMPAPGSTYLVYITVGKVFRLLQAVPRGKCQGNFLPKQFISFIGQQTVRNFCDFEQIFRWALCILIYMLSTVRFSPFPYDIQMEMKLLM